jgi:hypothetical protein
LPAGNDGPPLVMLRLGDALDKLAAEFAPIEQKWSIQQDSTTLFRHVRELLTAAA